MEKPGNSVIRWIITLKFNNSLMKSSASGGGFFLSEFWSLTLFYRNSCSVDFEFREPLIGGRHET